MDKLLPHFVNYCVSQPFTWHTPIGGILVLLIIWSLAWKAVALWKAARKNQVWWFVALMLINTMGLLEILYIYVFADWGKNTLPNHLKILHHRRLQLLFNHKRRLNRFL